MPTGERDTETTGWPADGRSQPSQQQAAPADALSAEGVVTVCGGCGSECAFRARVVAASDAGVPRGGDGLHGGDGQRATGDDRRAGDAQLRVTAQLPVVGHPCEAQRLCGRGKRRLQLPFVEDERVTHPLRRRPDGAFERVGWDEAYAEIAQRLRAVIDAHGPRSLACTTGMSSYHAWHARRLMAALGSPNVYDALGACESSRLAGWAYTLGYSPRSDLEHTNYIVYLGRSLIDSGSAGTGDALERARERGAGIVTVDPRRNSTVDHATEWFKIRPGHDLALLLGIAHVLIEEDLYDHDFVACHTTGFDEFARAMASYAPEWTAQTCDVSRDAVLRVARGLGRARPRSVVDCGFHGGLGVAYANSVQTARMIALVDALLGCYGQPGGNLNPPRTLELGELDPTRFPAPPEPQGPIVGSDRYPLAEATGGLCTTIGESIELGEIRALVAYASNPAMGYGNAGDWMRMLSGLDLLVAIDIRMSETARLADFVLPDVTFLECDRGVGVAGSGLFYRNQVLEPLHPDTRPADRIFRELAGALGVGRYFDFTADDLAAARIAPFVPRGADPCEFLAGLRRTGFYETGIDLGARTGEPVICTLSGKIAFADGLWERVGLGRVPSWQPPLVEPDVERGEFRLISGNNPFESHTSTRMLATHRGDPAHARMSGVWLNAARAARAGIREGDLIEVYSELGCDRAIAHVTEDIHPEALFTSASPGGRSGRHAGKRSVVAGEAAGVAGHTDADGHAGAGRYVCAAGAAGDSVPLGVGPLDHTPLRYDPLTGAALTQENVVRVRKVGD